MDIIGFMHIYGVNTYKEIVENQIKRIEDSGLIDAVDRIYYTVIAEEPFHIDNKKYLLLNHSTDMTLFESYTLNALRNIAILAEEDFKVFYIHTKGVTRPNEKCKQDWRDMMEYFCLNQWQFAIEALAIADTAGVNIRHYGKHKMSRFHYSGNFWWANSNYIKTLPVLSEAGYGRKVNRWDAEFWIGDGNPRMLSLWNSRQHHGKAQYGPNNYEGKSPQMKYLGRLLDD